MGLHTQSAVGNAINKGKRLARVEKNVREDVRLGVLSPKDGAAIVAAAREKS
jgi:hypothetical protein